jgi:hypothetical protein
VLGQWPVLFENLCELIIIINPLFVIKMWSFPMHAMKANGSLHSNVGTTAGSVVSFTSTLICSRGNSPCSHWTSGWVGALKAKLCRPCCKISHDSSVSKPVAKALHRLYNPCFVFIRPSSLGKRLEDVDPWNSTPFRQI